MPGLTTAFAQGTHAARPAAATANTGYYYFETDTSALFQSTGASWVQLSTPFGSQSANTAYAGPTSGGATTPAFRALVAADIPALDASKITTGTIPSARLGNVGIILSNGIWTTGNSSLTKAFMATTGGTVFTDVTAAINGGTGATLNYGATNDALYIGSTSANSGQFYRYTMTRATAPVWSMSFQYEFWNGSIWTVIPASVNWHDNLINWTFGSASNGFLPPATWTTTTVNGVSAWWIRVRCSSFTSTTTSAVFKSATLSRWSDATNTAVNGLAPAHGTITTACNGGSLTTDAYAFYNFTSNTYTVLSANPSPLIMSGLSIPVSAGDAYGVLGIPSASGAPIPYNIALTLTLG